MSLANRISLPNADEHDDPEDFFGSGLGSIFPDEAPNLHGDPGQTLIYKSPHLSEPLLLRLCNPTLETDRTLFSHYLWNASLLLAELIEADTLGVPSGTAAAPRLLPDVSFDVRDRHVLELGAGAGLGSIMAGLLGAKRVVASDYPSETVLGPLRDNLQRGVVRRAAAAAAAAAPASCDDKSSTQQVAVEGHAWGALDDDFSTRDKHAFDRIMAADVLWMPWQHDNLRRSVDHFLARDDEARAWIIGGLHTGRANMALFLDEEELKRLGLEIEHIWERDCQGAEREWKEVREDDDRNKKRWLNIIVLKRT
ncbi:hypothetical protein LEL_03232 [Akanthomyces lecanii RCEF 1005]|uniref:Nicotinamide N-methyltransferase n=1 Tax=Akanthomyces lecanii RCEF 1005 TaxID=1081108 RepID=A0A168IWS6_CORDF|nr:hypothetical protein LEL_03232 [Akanthomyces lecanii RCEF 1005]